MFSKVFINICKYNIFCKKLFRSIITVVYIMDVWLNFGYILIAKKAFPSDRVEEHILHLARVYL